MSSRITSTLDPFSPDFRADPYAAYDQLRALGPVVWLEQHGIWCVHHYDTCMKVLSNYEVYSNAGGGGIKNYFHEEPWRPPSIILEVDPPDHTRTRTVMNRVLGPRILRELREGFEAVAGTMVDEARALGDVDGVDALSRRFPLKVFPDSVGLAEDGRDKLLVYGAMVFGAFGPEGDWYRSFMAENADVPAWIMDRCQRANLSPDGIGEMIYAAADDGQVTPEEALMLVRTFLSAGVDTTVDSIGLALKLLAEHPEQYARLRADPGLARNAFDEATRFDSSSQSLFRTTLCDTELAGQAIGKHEKVMVFIGSAGRDGAHFDDPDTFDITRRIKGQMGYGVGPHGCVGQMFARLEGEVLLRAVAERVERLELTGPAEFRLNPGLRGLSRLPMALH